LTVKLTLKLIIMRQIVMILNEEDLEEDVIRAVKKASPAPTRKLTILKG
jgi:hypothetical protein